jgi:ABC-type branched-subunit amino acid transport system ATPase component
MFTDLTVREDLETDGITLPTKQAVNDGMEGVFALFPALKERLEQRSDCQISRAA